MIKQFKGVIFDVDGLLIDSEPVWFLVNTEILRRRNLLYTDEIKQLITGMGHKEIGKLYTEKFGFSKEQEVTVSEMRQTFYELADELQLMEGAMELVEYLHKAGYKLAIATGGHSEEKIRELLSHLQLLQYFSVIVTSDMVAHGKPEPDIFFAAAKRMQLSPATCLVLEDAVNGVVAAKAAGMSVYGVNPDEQMRTHLIQKEADKVYSSLATIQKDTDL